MNFLTSISLQYRFCLPRISPIICKLIYQLGARFGPLQCTETYVGKSLPALVTNLAEAHPDVRAYTLSILKERLGSVQSAWQHSSDNFYKNLWTNGRQLYIHITEDEASIEVDTKYRK